jgi:hypothetical protein
VVVQVQAPRTPPRGRERLSVVLALDVSGSMQGPPLAHLVQATARLLDRLQDGDSVGMVTFSSRVTVAAPLRPLDESTRAHLRQSLQELFAEGGTDLGEALACAGRLFASPQADERQVLLLVSDGQPTAGLGSSQVYPALAAHAGGPGSAGPRPCVSAASCLPEDSIEQAWEQLLWRTGLAAGHGEGTGVPATGPSTEPASVGPMSRRSAALRADEAAPRNLPNLLFQAELLRRRGVTVSTLGCGPEHDGALLAALATAGGGRNAAVDDPEHTERALVEVLGAPLALVLQKPRLLLRPSEDASLGRVLGDLQGRVKASGLEIALPDLFSGGSCHVVIEATMSAWREGSWGLLWVDLEGTSAGGEPVTAQATASVEVAAGLAPRYHLPTLALTAVAAADERRERARTLAARQDRDGAIELLRRAVADLEATPGFASGDGSLLDDARRVLLDDLATHAPLSGGLRGVVLGSMPRPVSLLLSRDLPLRLASLDALDQRRATPALRPASLRFTAGPRCGEWALLDRMRMILGSGAPCEIRLGDGTTARYLAILEQFGRESWIFDLESPGGVWVNGRAVRCHHLSSGDVIRLGEHEAVFAYSGRAASAPPPSPPSLSSR